MWTISSKTFHSWQRTICCGLCSTAPAKHGSAGATGSLNNPALLAASAAANRPLIPAANPPPAPPPHYHYMPMTVSSMPSSHVIAAQNAAGAAWKQSKIV
ncbi:unnamed protein product [Gongylonema pulchrum]|uniref:GATA-type domain-containing protein n=1 Tax=Gongylonema pulchrum TaxID=637853 RepID=A0A183CU88_9BILA|nr:unnamed protein product [Gongylonema pulchrum]